MNNNKTLVSYNLNVAGKYTNIVCFVIVNKLYIRHTYVYKKKRKCLINCKGQNMVISYL